MQPEGSGDEGRARVGARAPGVARRGARARAGGRGGWGGGRAGGVGPPARGPPPPAGAGEVVAFTLSSMPLRASGGAAVHVLDARDGHAEAFGADLPGDPERALAEARRRMATPAGRAALERIAAAAAGNALAGRLGIEKLPPVGGGGRSVV